MTVQCPRCRTQYKVPNARISDPRPVFKCTRCSLVFSREAERPARPGARGRDDERNLALPFGSQRDPAGRRTTASEPRIAGPDDPTVHDDLEDESTLADETEDEREAPELDEPPAGDDDSEPEDEAGEDDSEDDSEDEPTDDGDEEEDDEEEETPPRRPARRAAAAAPSRRERPERRAARGSDEEPAFVAHASRERETPPARGRRRDGDLRFRRDDDLEPGADLEEDDEPRRPVLVASEGKQRRAPINPRRATRAAADAGSRSPLRAIAIGVAAVVAVYFALAVFLDRQPARALETLSGVPLLGSLLGGDHLLLWRLQLAGVEGKLEEIKGGRPAYVVSGRAINTSNEDLRIIEIEGRLLTDGVEQRRQVVYAANQPRKTIRDLSPSEVEMLLRLEPNRRFVIRPGESASFLLVFPDPPRDTTEVTCRVVNARTA